MSVRIRLVLLFSLSAIAALVFFGYIAYDTAARDNDRREADLLRQAFAPFAPRLATAIESGHGIHALLAHWTADYHDRLAVSVTDRAGMLRYASPNYRRVAAAKGHAVWLTLPLAATGMAAHIGFQSSEGDSLSYLARMRRSLIFAALIVVWVAGWGAMYLAGLIEKLHDQKDALLHRAMHDTLTDLANRALLCQRLTEAVSRSNSKPRPFALCFIDLDRFKEVNDTQGHLCGDKLLMTVANRLKRIIRQRDTVARLGGDEFAVLLHDVDRREALSIVEKTIRCIEQDVLIDDNAYSVSCSVGIAMYPEDGDDPQTLLMRADIAMYEAKSKSVAWRFFDEELLRGTLPPSSAVSRPVCVLQQEPG